MVTSWIAAVLLAQQIGPQPIQAERVGNYLEFPATIGGKPLKLILDSGAGSNVLVPKAADRIGITGGVPIQAIGVGGKPVPARLVEVEKFAVGTHELPKSQAAVIELPAILESDGLIGFNLLNAYITKIDYDKAQITLYERKEFVPPKDFIKVPLRVRRGISEIKMSVAGASGWAKVDTGASDALTLFKSFIDSHDIKKYVSYLRQGTGGTGVGGTSLAEEGVLSGIEVARHRFQPMRISLSQMTSGAFADSEAMGNLGSELLRRFTVILDYGGASAYFKPNSQIDDIQRVNRTGLKVDLVNGKNVVLAVDPNSPGSAAGIQAGDVIESIDGVSATSKRALNVWMALRKRQGSKAMFVVRSKDGGTREVELTYRDPN